MEGLKIFNEGAKKLPPPEIVNEVSKPKDVNVVILRVDPESVAKRTTEALKNGEVLSVKPLRGGGEHLNQTSFVSIMHKGEVVNAIFKPKSGEMERTVDPNVAEAGEYYKHEVAARAVDEFFGFNLVPPTVVREINGEIGSVQRMIPGAAMESEVLPFPRGEDSDLWDATMAVMRKKMIPQFQMMLVLDLAIWGTDRHHDNYLVDKATKSTITAIDHGFSFKSPPADNFNLAPRVYPVEADGTRFFSFTSLPHKFHFHQPYAFEPEVVEAVIAAAADNQKLAELTEKLAPFTSNSECAACLGRIKRIAKILKENDGTWPKGDKNALYYEGEDLVVK